MNYNTYTGDSIDNNRKLTEDFDLPHVCLLIRRAMMHISEIHGHEYPMYRL